MQKISRSLSRTTCAAWADRNKPCEIFPDAWHSGSFVWLEMGMGRTVKHQFGTHTHSHGWIMPYLSQEAFKFGIEWGIYWNIYVLNFIR